MNRSQLDCFASQLKSKIDNYNYNNHIDLQKEGVANNSDLVIVLDENCKRYEQLEKKIIRTINKNKYVRQVHKKQDVQNPNNNRLCISDVSMNFESQTEIYVREF